MATARQFTPGKRSTAWFFGLGMATLGGALIQAPAAHASPGLSTPGTDPTAAISAFTGALPNYSLSNTTYGYLFTTTSALSVKSLGVFDSGSNGLIDDHAVGIWDSSGTNLLASITIPSGSSATLVNGFRYLNLPTALSLDASTSYVIGAYFPQDLNLSGDQIASGANLPTLGAGIVLGNNRLSAPPNVTSLKYPLNFQNNAVYGFFGPNFRTEAVPAPLPVFGAATAFGFSRRLRKRIRRSSLLG